MKKLIVAFLIVTTISIQGCVIAIGNGKGKQCPSPSEPKTSYHPKTAVQATLENINSMFSENNKVEALEALMDTPMSESDYVAMMKVIKNLFSENDKQRLTIKAINARKKFQPAEPHPVPDCNN